MDRAGGRWSDGSGSAAGVSAMADRALHVLATDAIEVAVCPEVGGCLTAFRHGGVDLMRPAGPEVVADGDVRGASCFPLVPFSNRIADAAFGFEGRVYRLEPNFPPEPHAIHGQGWQRPWKVLNARPTRLELGLSQRVPDTPLVYDARQTIAVEGSALTITLDLACRGEYPMPAGLGLHPFFVRTPGVALKANLSHVWLADGRKLPRERVDVPEGWRFRPPRPIDPLELDHCFDGFDGKASIVWPELARRLEIKTDPLFGHAVIYVPAGQSFFCFEPVSHVNDGFNLLDRGVFDTGVRVLKPGQRLTGKVTFEIV